MIWVEEGGFYVKDRGGTVSVREVVRLTDDGDVRYRRYDLGSGRYVSPGGCSVVTMTDWADREATEEEVCRLRRGDARSEEKEFADQIAETVLTGISDRSLLDEVRRRGLAVPL